MFGRVLSALFSFSGWLFKSAMVKWFLFFGLFFITTEFVDILVGLLPTTGDISSAFSIQGSGVWYFLDLFRLDYGISVCLAAAATKFIIRRIPVIG